MMPKVMKCSIKAGVSLLITLLMMQGANAAYADSKVELDGLFHDQGELFCQPNEPLSTSDVLIRFRCFKSDVTGIELQYSDESDKSKHVVGMNKENSPERSRFEYWRAIIPAGRSIKRYRFKITDGSATAWYNANGASFTESSNADFSIIPDFKTPNWLKHGVIYQIFPDRFFNGNPANDVRTNEYKYGKDKPVHKKWGESPIPTHGESPAFSFYGGDLEGVIAKLGYIRETLGANIVYLNPIFKSPSNHKYDTVDYMHVDTHFGTNQTLQKLAAALHEDANGKRGYLILDAVFNHTGDGNLWFGKYSYERPASAPPGAYRSKKSPFYSYYTFTKWPDKYATFLDVKSLPKLDYGSQKVKDVIYAKPDSIALHYLKPPYNIDGWRLDAPQYADANGKQGSDAVNHAIWREFRTAIKTACPNAAILGENWGKVDSWTAAGDQWDCATNFEGFTKPVSEWLTGQDYDNKPGSLTASQFDRQLRLARAKYPTNVQQAMSNHLSNHDISRFAERAHGEARLSQLALLFQMTYIGAPTIYYGDEYAMRGKSDPDDRRTFDWSLVDSGNKMIEFTHKLISIRDKYPALRTGSFVTLVANDKTGAYAFGRIDKSSKIAVVLNNSAVAHTVEVPAYKMDIQENASFFDALTGKSHEMRAGMVAIQLEPYAGAILIFSANTGTQ